MSGTHEHPSVGARGALCFRRLLLRCGLGVGGLFAGRVTRLGIAGSLPLRTLGSGAITGAVLCRPVGFGPGILRGEPLSP